MPESISPGGSPVKLPPMTQVQSLHTINAAGQSQDSVKNLAASLPIQEPERSTVQVDLSQSRIEDNNTNADKPDPPTLEEASKALKEYIEGLPSNLQFSKDKETGIFSFKVVNPVTQEVIKQYPPEDMMKLYAKLRELGPDKSNAGFLLDDKF